MDEKTAMQEPERWMSLPIEEARLFPEWNARKRYLMENHRIWWEDMVYTDPDALEESLAQTVRRTRRAMEAEMDAWEKRDAARAADPNRDPGEEIWLDPGLFRTDWPKWVGRLNTAEAQVRERAYATFVYCEP